MRGGDRRTFVFKPYQMLSPSPHSFYSPAVIRYTKNKNEGLRYEDLLIEEDPSTAEALKLADPEVLTGRTRRLKRAIDLSYKRKSLLDYAPDMDQETFKMDVIPDIERIRERDQEYAQLNAHNKM